MKLRFVTPLFLVSVLLPGILRAATPTTTILSSSPNPSTFGQPVTITAQLSSSAATGKLTFFNGVTIIGIAALSGGVAILTTTMLPSGVSSLTAYYSGDSAYSPSASPPVRQTVRAVGVQVASGPYLDSDYCADVSGTWNVTQSVRVREIVTSAVENDDFTNSVSSQGSINIVQTGCSISFAPSPIPGLVTQAEAGALTRTGSVVGNTVSFQGLLTTPTLAVAAVPGLTITQVSKNQFEASGQLTGAILTTTDSGNFTGTGTYSKNGQSGSFTLSYILTGNSTLVRPSPTITSLSPSSAPAGGPAFTLTVNGNGYAAGAVVYWDSSPLPTTYINSTQLTASVPASFITSAGTVLVSVNSAGTQSNQVPFSSNSGLTIGSLSPPSATAGGPTFTMTVNGSGFARDAVVNWNGSPLPTTFVTATQLTTVVDASLIAAPGPSTVTVTSGGATSNSATFTVSPRSDKGSIITTFAGNGGFGFSGDGGPATLAMLATPRGIALDSAGNLFVAEFNNNRIRRISPQGVITTVAGNGTQGFSGDGGPAISAALNRPRGVAVGASGNLFIADTFNRRVRMVSPSGIITTVAGSDHPTSLGDGGPATDASISPADLAIDASANLFIADFSRVHKVSPTGIISTVAGNGADGSSGDGGLATAASFNAAGVAVDASGNIFIADSLNNRIRKVSTSGIISTAAGSGTAGYSGDGGLATAAALNSPQGVAVDASGNVYIVDGGNSRVREVSRAGIITTIAGSGTAGYSGDGGPATAAQLSLPANIAVDSLGNYFISEAGAHRIRKVSASNSAAPIITPGGIAPLYNSVNTIQSGEWFSIYGSNLASSTAFWNGDFPTSLGGASVTVNGKAAYLSYASATQINVQAPDDTTLGSVPVTVTNPGGTATATVTLAQLAPSFLLFDNKHVAGIIPRSDGSGAYGGGTYDLLGPTGNSLGSPTVAAQPGDVVALFGTGFGPTNPAVFAGQSFSGAAPATSPVKVLINNVSVTPSFAGLTGAGLNQINVTIPAGLGTGDVSLVATVGGAQTQSGVVISLQAGSVSAPPQLQSLTLSPTSVASGGMVTGSVVLSVSAPPGGAIVALSSSSSAASVPATVTVPAGATSTTFTVSATSVSSSQTVTITASYSGKSVQATLSVAAATGSNGSCQAVTQGPYKFQVVNTLSTDILVYLGDVILPTGQHGSVSFGAQMHPNECDIIGLPQIASYSVAVNRYPNGTVVNNTLTFTDTTSGFVFNGRSAYTLRVTQGTCSAAADQGITFNGKSVYSLCLP